MKQNGLLDNKINCLQLLVTFTVTVLTLSTPTVTAVNSNDPLGCSITWHIEDQTVAMNGIQMAGITTADACQDYCISLPHCIACEFDYSIRNDTHGCWFHQNINDLKELYNGINVTHYEVISSCPERRNGAVPASVDDNSVPKSHSGQRLHNLESGFLLAVLTMISLLLVNHWKI